jgi:DNA-binding transcriptional regulator YhcF (GntR family)
LGKEENVTGTVKKGAQLITFRILARLDGRGYVALTSGYSNIHRNGSLTTKRRLD